MRDKKKIIAIINLNYSGLDVVLNYFYFLKSKKKNYDFSIALGELSIYEKLKKDQVSLDIIQDLGISLIIGNFKNEKSISFFFLNKLAFFFPKKYYFFFFYNLKIFSVLNSFFKSDYIFHEYGNDLKYTGIINFVNKFKLKNIYLFNSATAPEFFLKYEKKNHGKIDIRKNSKFLIYDLSVKNVYSRMGFTNFYETGYLRYDKNWLDYKMKLFENRYKYFKKFIVIFSKNYPDQNIDKDLRLNTFNNIIRILNKYYNIEILIKPHPRDNISLLETIAKNFKNVRLTFKDSMYLVLKSEFIISLSSSIIFDALVLKKKHIDFYLKQAMRHQPSGSRWQQLGILSTTSFKELEYIISLDKFKLDNPLINNLPTLKFPNL